MTSPRTPLRTKILAGILAGSALLGAAAINADDAVAQQAPSSEEAEQRFADRAERIEERIAEAIENGRITQEQADELRAKFTERMAQANERMAERQARLDDLAASLGTTADELIEARKAGQSIADIAEANGVDVQGIIDDMVQQGNDRIDEAVAEGRIDEDRAAELKENLEERVTAKVNGEVSERGHGRFRGHRGHNGEDAGAN